MKNSKISKILNPKFLSVLSLGGFALFFTGETTNAMFKNPALKMPLAKSTSGKPIFLSGPSGYSPTSYVISGEERTNLKFSGSNITSKSSASSSSNTLRNLGDKIHTNTSSSNLGAGLRRAGDRFVNNQ